MYRENSWLITSAAATHQQLVTRLLPCRRSSSSSAALASQMESPLATAIGWRCATYPVRTAAPQLGRPRESVEALAASGVPLTDPAGGRRTKSATSTFLRNFALATTPLRHKNKVRDVIAWPPTRSCSFPSSWLCCGTRPYRHPGMCPGIPWSRARSARRWRVGDRVSLRIS